MGARLAFALMALVGTATASLTTAGSNADEMMTGDRLSHSERLYRTGKAAFARKEYELCIDYMLEVYLDNPNNYKARSYLDASSRKLRDQRERRIEQAREEALQNNSVAMEIGREKAQLWAADLEAARRLRKDGAWLLAVDRYLKLLESNPKHAEGRAELSGLQRRIAKRLDQGRFHDVKERHLYSALFHHLQRDDKKAVEEFEAALSFDHLFAELSQAAIKGYIARLSSSEETPKVRTVRANKPHKRVVKRPRRQKIRRQRPPRRRIVRAVPSAPIATPIRTTANIPATSDTLSDLVKRSADSFYKKATLLHRQKKMKDAVDAYTKLLAIAPDYPGAQEAYFLATQDLQREEANLKEQAKHHYQKGLAQYASGHLEEARASWSETIAADPSHPYAMKALMRVHKDLERKTR